MKAPDGHRILSADVLPALAGPGRALPAACCPLSARVCQFPRSEFVLSTAILTGPPVAGSSLEHDLRSLGFEVHVARDARDAWEAASVAAQTAPGERLALVDPRFVGHTHALRLALKDPRFDASALPGVLGIAPSARAALGRLPAAGPDETADALEAEGVAVHRPELGVLVAAVPESAQERHEAREAVAAVDDEKVRLRSAVKSRDGFFTTFCISPYSRYLARWCARRGLTPNQVTTGSLLTALIAAACAATGERAGFVAAGVLLIASFVLDATDGQLARYDLQYSKLGAWLDATFDRAKEYAYYVGLALGASRGGDDVWALALGAMLLMTARHTVDFSFNESNAGVTGNASPTAALSGRLDSVGWTVWLRRMIILPIGERWALIAVLTAVTTPRITFVVLLIAGTLAACYTTAGRLLRSISRRTPRTRQAAEGVGALTDSGILARGCARLLGGVRLPRFGPPALALLGTAVILATAWGAPVGSWWPVLAAAVYALLTGLSLVAPLTGPLDWLLPPLFRIAEYGTVLVLAARASADGALPAAYGLVAAVAYHHYDTVYRIRGGTGAPPHWLVSAVGGHEGRTVLVTVAAALWLGGGGPAEGIDGFGAFDLALTALAVVIAAVVLVESIRFWVSSHAPAVHDETGEPA